MRNYLLVLWVMVFFLVVGCATPEPRVKVLEKPVYVEKPKRVDVNTVISQLSHQISSTMLEQNKRRVAVMNFSLVTGEMTDLGIYLSDKLTNSLFQYRDKFEVVERTRLESVLKEIKLGFTGIIDDKTAQSIGKILGADAIVIGTITDLGEEIDINIRMLGTERANVLAVASALLEKSDAIVKLMANVRITDPSITTTKPSQPQPKKEQRVEVNGFIFEAKECKVSGQRVTCTISITNDDVRTKTILVEARNPGMSIMVDDLGNQHSPVGAWFGGKGGEGFNLPFQLEQAVPPRLPMNLSFKYEGLVPGVRYASPVVDFQIFGQGFFKAVLRNIPLNR